MAPPRCAVLICLLVCLIGSSLSMPYIPDPEDDFNENELNAGKFEGDSEEIDEDDLLEFADAEDVEWQPDDADEEEEEEEDEEEDEDLKAIIDLEEEEEADADEEMEAEEEFDEYDEDVEWKPDDVDEDEDDEDEEWIPDDADEDEDEDEDDEDEKVDAEEEDPGFVRSLYYNMRNFFTGTGK